MEGRRFILPKISSHSMGRFSRPPERDKCASPEGRESALLRKIVYALIPRVFNGPLIPFLSHRGGVIMESLRIWVA